MARIPPWKYRKLGVLPKAKIFQGICDDMIIEIDRLFRIAMCGDIAMCFLEINYNIIKNIYNNIIKNI